MVVLDGLYKTWIILMVVIKSDLRQNYNLLERFSRLYKAYF